MNFPFLNFKQVYLMILTRRKNPLITSSDVQDEENYFLLGFPFEQREDTKLC